MDSFSAAVVILLTLIAFLIGFCAYALGVALLYRLPEDAPPYPFIRQCVNGTYAALRIASWIIVPTFAIWGVWLMVSWVSALLVTQ